MGAALEPHSKNLWERVATPGEHAFRRKVRDVAARLCEDSREIQRKTSGSG